MLRAVGSPSSPTGGWLLAAVASVAIVGTLLAPRIPQDPSYHLFADTRTIGGIPNFWNVISNLPFALVGIYGLARVRRLASRALRPGYIVFCVAVIGVCFGSAYYHYAPSTPALVWDRLPMAIAFMAVAGGSTGLSASGGCGTMSMPSSRWR